MVAAPDPRDYVRLHVGRERVPAGIALARHVAFVGAAVVVGGSICGCRWRW